MSASLRLEVLVARIAPGLAIALDVGEQRALGLEVLEDRLDDHVGLRATPSPATSGIRRSMRVAHAARVAQALA